MLNDDQTLESGAGGSAEELELAPKEETLDESGGDPLDDIQDSAARDLAKKHRAIARRQEKKEITPEVKPEVKPVATVQGEFLTKADFYKSNERKAVREATADAEVKANWSEIVKFYSPRHGKETAEDIKEDIQDAITLFNSRNAKTTKDESANVLTTNTVVKTGGGPIGKSTASTPTPPNFKLPAQPSDWYGKKK